MWHNLRLLNTVATSVALGVATVLLGASLHALLRLPAFDLRYIEVVNFEGNPPQHLQADLLQRALQGQLSGNFFTASLPEWQRQFEQQPWVRRAAVERVWPGGMRVRVEEHHVLGSWNDNALLNIHGESFVANLGDVEPPALRFQGPPDSERQVATRYAELRAWLAPLQQQIVRVSLSERYAWQVELDSGLIIDLGRDPGPGSVAPPIAERIGRLVRAMPAVQAHLGRTPEYIDLRYPNGFALRAEGVLRDPAARPASGAARPSTSVGRSAAAAQAATNMPPAASSAGANTQTNR